MLMRSIVDLGGITVSFIFRYMCIYLSLNNKYTSVDNLTVQWGDQISYEIVRRG